MIIYDANKQILGRFASVIAKQLLNGERVIVVNAEKALISGNPKSLLKEYLEKRQRGDPFHGPFFPSTANGILRRTIRGMLPWDRTRGRVAYKNLKVFVGVPENLKGKEKEFKKIKEAENKLRCKSIDLGELCKNL